MSPSPVGRGSKDTLTLCRGWARAFEHKRLRDRHLLRRTQVPLAATSLGDWKTEYCQESLGHGQMSGGICLSVESQFTQGDCTQKPEIGRTCTDELGGCVLVCTFLC